MKLATVILLGLCFLGINLVAGPLDYVCGDANGDGTVDVGDAVFLINYIFKNGPAPSPEEAGDANGDGNISVGDAVFVINYVFKGGPVPSGCGGSVIVPLAIGNRWVTHITEYNQSGQITTEYTGTGVIVDDTTINDTTWYLLETDTAGVDTSVTTNKDDGLWAMTDSTSNPEVLLLKYPANPGDSYPLYEATVTVESIDTSVTVPAGTFICYYYRVHIPIYGTLYKIFAAPNIGVVRSEEYTLTLFGTYLSKVAELESYELVQ